MKRHHVAVVAVLITVLAVRTEAFLGIGDVVFDPSVFAQAVEQVTRLERQYVQLVQSYEMLHSQYDQMVRNASRIPVDAARRYRALQTPWTAPRASDLYGATSGWTHAAATGAGVTDGFRDATEALRDYGALFGSLPVAEQGYVKTSYGTVELTDGVTQGTLETIGQLRANASSVQAALLRLEDDSLSSSPDMNTEVGVLNKINAASIIGLRSAQDTNGLLVALAEQQAVLAKRTRDAEARAINQHIRFVAEAKPILTAQTSGASDAMRAWRMP